jgi:hypothetical protein
MKHLWLYKYLNVLKQNHQFLSTHGRIKNFSSSVVLSDMIEVKDIKKLSKTTKVKLELVSNLLFVNWLYCIPYFTYPSDRKGQFFYGLSFNGNLINYHRKETGSPQAGQTIIHVNNRTLQITKLLNNKHLTKRDKEVLKELKELINTDGIDKMLFESI